MLQVLAYGQTGSGKTYSMGSTADPQQLNGRSKPYGVIPRALITLFEGLQQLQPDYEVASKVITYPSSYCAKDICTVQDFLYKSYTQQNKLDGLLCTAILGFSGILGWTLGLQPRLILGCLTQPRLCMCSGGYLLRSS